ncbi:MAG: amidophosphoribosyltransferase, partial [Pseudomonadota bacterium]
MTEAFDATPFDDAFTEECGVYGVHGVDEAANYVALGLHALQHRGQEAAGVSSYDPETEFNTVRRMGLVRDNFTKQSVMDLLPGRMAIGHTRYSTAGAKGPTSLRDVQPFYADFALGGCAVAHNGNLTNADELRRQLIERGSIFQSGSDTECIVHLMARSIQRTIPERMKDALRLVEGAFSVIAMTRTKLIGVRDPLGVRPLVLGRMKQGGWILSSETCALDIVGAELVREVEPGEMVIVSKDGVDSTFPFEPKRSRFCVFEYVYFSRPDSVIGGTSVYEARRRIGVELAKEAPVEADLVCPVPDSGTPAAIGYSQESGIPYAMGIIKNQYVGRTFIEPTDQIRDMGVRLKLNINRAIIEGQRLVLVDDSVVRGTTTRKIKDMLLDAGAREVHFRIASPPTKWPCFYGVDTPERSKLLAARMSEDEIRDHLGVDSLRYVSLDGLYR